ncbi:MAG: hypothetical protein JXB47_12770 [Anaerolineae bacterium]|nr:hypothetical protein [Anaerolineae bacterium]
MGQTQFTTFRDAEEFAAGQGVVLTANDRAKIAELQQAEQARRATLAGRESFFDWFNANYVRLLDLLLHAGNLLLALTRTVAISLGVPAILVLLLLVEQQRITDGVSLFESRPHLASFGAWAIVIANTVLEFLIHYVEQITGYSDGRKTRFSLRTWWQQMRYVLGLGKAWREQQHSPALRYKRLQAFITLAILVLALSGSMREVIAAQPGAWHAALAAIVEQSTLSQMSTWLSGLLFAGVAVVSAQGVSRYVAMRVVEILAELRGGNGAVDDSALDDVAVAYLMAKVAKQQERGRAKHRREETPGLIPLSGNGRH